MKDNIVLWNCNDVKPNMVFRHKTKRYVWVRPDRVDIAGVYMLSNLVSWFMLAEDWEYSDDGELEYWNPCHYYRY